VCPLSVERVVVWFASELGLNTLAATASWINKSSCNSLMGSGKFLTGEIRAAQNFNFCFRIFDSRFCIFEQKFGNKKKFFQQLSAPCLAPVDRCIFLPIVGAVLRTCTTFTAK